ncbi:hypothetical protein AVEN_60575-1 [Araneus ventricosus]|uniref:Uncharacterized protein n=1 Tax=Araneus ventricosus TaxID=182803 RepID=A0A4Y2EYB6_ARAVE|nr:hypothetical protein AVEN_60575-1 [Araneus ventricosus]
MVDGSLEFQFRDLKGFLGCRIKGLSNEDGRYRQEARSLDHLRPKNSTHRIAESHLVGAHAEKFMAFTYMRIDQLTEGRFRLGAEGAPGSKPDSTEDPSCVGTAAR